MKDEILNFSIQLMQTNRNPCLFCRGFNHFLAGKTLHYNGCIGPLQVF